LPGWLIYSPCTRDFWQLYQNYVSGRGNGEEVVQLV